MQKSNQLPKTEDCSAEGKPVDLWYYRTQRPSQTGTPQSGVVSPVLANIYLHYALDLWFERVVQPQQQGRCRLIRYADDFVACFEYRHEAQAFEAGLKTRFTSARNALR